MKKESHESITALALKLFANREESSQLSEALTNKRFSKALVKGTNDEDDFSVPRGANWHFYPANNTILNEKRQVLGINIYPTSDKILHQREGEFNDLLKDGASRSLFSTFGRILHHIQDMSTPSHVRPVYHGPDKVDYYETFLVDEWEQLERKISDQNDLTDTTTYNVQSFVELYIDAANRTLAVLDLPTNQFQVVVNGETKQEKPTLFWKKYDPNIHPDVLFDFQGFGSFGPMGEHFGKFPPPAEVEYGIEPQVYVDQATLYTKSAVTDTLVALQMFEERVAQEFGNRTFVEEANPYLHEDDDISFG